MKKLFTTAVLGFIIGLVYGMERPSIVAHRGFHRAEGSAQNSIRSLIKADSIGADYCEFDVWLSADSILYVNHNADINGVVIETSESVQIDTCHLKNGEFIPRLETFLDSARVLNIGLALEVKPHKNPERENIAVPMIVEMIKNKGLSDRTIYITFSKNAHQLLIDESGRPVYYLTGVEPEVLVDMKSSGADFHISHFKKHPDWIDRIHGLGLEVNIWTIDSEEDIQWAIDNGADFITTNEPVLAKKLLEKQ